VHVWCSFLKPCSDPQFSGKPTLGLIAGFYVHSGGLPVSVFYKWLRFILKLGRGDDFESMALFPCQDPRGRALSVGTIPPVAKPLRQDLANPIEIGHYMLYQYDRKQKNFVAIWPTLASNDFRRRSRTASQTCTPSPGSTSSGNPPRNTKTRLDVRMRDKCCLITGQAAVKRARGGNFTGLEVAHLFPLMGVGDITWTNDMAADAQAEVRTRERADTPQNAILLRADIHTLFDDYQWSLWPTGGKTFKVIRFEKSGATALAEHNDAINLGPSSLATVSSPSVALIREHFRIALLLHVRGFGRRATAGFQSTLL